MTFHVVIPARYASSRLPGKPLLELAGKPMLQHVHERALASGADSVFIATDDERIEQTAREFGARVCMTSSEHRSGTERLAEAIERAGWSEREIIVNVQGDEPLVPPALIRQVARDLADHPSADVATLCTPIHTAAELFDPHVVKVVTDRYGFALYFSRAAIPWDRDAFSVTTECLPEQSNHARHLGLYAYRAGYVRNYVRLEPCPMERMESLEQLRVLWYGGRIRVSEAVEQPGPGVDTPEDVERVRRVLSGED